MQTTQESPKSSSAFALAQPATPSTPTQVRNQDIPPRPAAPTPLAGIFGSNAHTCFQSTPTNFAVPVAKRPQRKDTVVTDAIYRKVRKEIDASRLAVRLGLKLREDFELESGEQCKPIQEDDELKKTDTD